MRFLGYFGAFTFMAFGIIGIIVLDYTPNPYDLFSLGVLIYIVNKVDED